MGRKWMGVYRWMNIKNVINCICAIFKCESVSFYMKFIKYIQL